MSDQEVSTDTTKPMIKVATCMPEQRYDRQSKLDWLDRTVSETDCDLFCTSQEFVGGHFIMKDDRHIDRDWLIGRVGLIARNNGKHIAIGACCNANGGGATEDYLYIDDNGQLLGYHSKMALPAYDDVRAGGHGNLWPETNYRERATPIDIPKLRLRAGTVFCWECYNQTLWGAYSLEGCNIICHPIKFAPRGWLINKTYSDGLKHIDDFGHAPKSTMWNERLVAAGKFQCMCPIAVSCNSWDLGPKFMALVGHVDELRGTTTLLDVPSIGTQQKIHVFEMLPEYYEGLDHHHSAGAFKAHTGSVEGFSEMGEWTMATKIRRLEAHLIGGTTKLDCQMKAASAGRQKKSSTGRAFGKIQKVGLKKKEK